MTKNIAKAKKAMQISKKYREITLLRQIIETKFRDLEEMVKDENHPDFSTEDIIKLRLAHAEAFRSALSRGEAIWHNVAHDHGYFETDAKPKKMSKSDQYK